MWWSVWLTLMTLGSPSAAPQPQTLALRVASYNAWLLPFASDDLIGRTAQMGPALRALEADVICLQEVWYQDSADAIRGALASRLHFGIVAGGGLVTLSRWPIIGTEFIPFDEHPEMSMIERFAKKGWLVTVLMTPVGPIEVINTHLVWEGRNDKSKEQRVHWAQLQALNRAVAHRREHPTIVCGDLNHRAIADGKPTDEFSLWLGNGFVDAAGSRPDGEGRWTTRARTRVGYPRGPHIAPRGGDPDYVLTRAGRQVAIVAKAFRQALDTADTALSDHNLLLVDLELTR